MTSAAKLREVARIVRRIGAAHLPIAEDLERLANDEEREANATATDAREARATAGEDAPNA